MRKKLNYLGLTVIILLALILLKDLRDSDVFITMTKILKPFLYGFIISYFLNPVIEWIRIKTNLKKIYVIGIVYVLLGLFIYLGIKFLAPILISNLKFFLRDLPNSIDKLIGILDEKILGRLSPEISKEFEAKVFSAFESLGKKGIDLGMIVHYTKYATDFLMNLAIGLVVSVYMIKDKEKLMALLKRLMYSYLEEDFADSIRYFFSELDRVFYRFLLGKIIDSSIMGVLFYITAVIIKAPYALIMAVIFGATNVIPYFGPLIGIVSCFAISLIYAPDYSIIILIISFLLQQFDGFYMGPKILGGKVGLSPFWTMATILITGGLFGIAGMLLAVPAASVVKVMLNRSMDKRLEKRNIDIEDKKADTLKKDINILGS